MTTPSKEKQERFEAKLRGWRRKTVYSESWWEDVWGFPVHPLSITTDTGKLDAMELLAEHYGAGVFKVPDYEGGEWLAWRGNQINEDRKLVERANSLPEAIEAAWYAAVEADA